jgi:hypothetical protein
LPTLPKIVCSRANTFWSLSVCVIVWLGAVGVPVSEDPSAYTLTSGTEINPSAATIVTNKIFLNHIVIIDIRTSLVRFTRAILGSEGYNGMADV